MILKLDDRDASQTFAYDDGDRLLSIERQPTGIGKQLGITEEKLEYTYDLLGRLTKEITPAGTLGYEYDPLSNLTTQTLPDGYAPLARVDQVEGEGQKVYYFHTDQIGTPLELTDSEGKIVWQATYRSWGAVEQLPVSKVEQNLRFQGQYFDRETGLHYSLFRYYDPETGRFITQDPISLQGGYNLYEYAPNALTWIDPLGLCKSAANGEKGRSKAMHDLERNGFKIVAEEVTMKVNGSRVRADFVARDAQGICMCSK
jgi:RHS repeat-associated protein